MPDDPTFRDLVRRLAAGYQVSVQGDSYFIAEGDLPREEVLRCVPVTFKIIEGAGHGFGGPDIDRQVAAFFDQQLKTK